MFRLDREKVSHEVSDDPLREIEEFTEIVERCVYIGISSGRVAFWVGAIDIEGEHVVRGKTVKQPRNVTIDGRRYA